jgi:hypothetical protein
MPDPRGCDFSSGRAQRPHRKEGSRPFPFALDPGLRARFLSRRPHAPDSPGSLPRFRRGQTGVLHSSYLRPDLGVAYPYLSGGALASAEQKGYRPNYSFSEEV